MLIYPAPFINDTRHMGSAGAAAEAALPHKHHTARNIPATAATAAEEPDTPTKGTLIAVAGHRVDRKAAAAVEGRPMKSTPMPSPTRAGEEEGTLNRATNRPRSTRRLSSVAAAAARGARTRWHRRAMDRRTTRKEEEGEAGRSPVG